MSIVLLMIGLGLLIYMTVRGINIVISAIIASSFVALTAGQNLVTSLGDTYMKGFTGFFASWFLLFLLGAIFGKIMGETKAAESIAAWVLKVLGPKAAVMAVVLACAVMTYGGVSLFVVGFSVYPLALSLFRQANLPRRFIPAALVFGSVTFTMFLPGSPEIQNIIPTQYFQTTPYSGFTIGLIVSILNFIMGSLFLMYVVNKAVKRGEKFEDRPTDPHMGSAAKEEVAAASSDPADSQGKPGLPHVALAIAPIVVVIVSLAVFSSYIDSTAAAIYSLLSGIVAACLLMFSFLNKFWASLAEGANEAIVAACNTSAVVAFGKVAATTEGFSQLVDAALQIPGPPLLSLGICINVIAGLTGSASGGLGIALPILAPIYLKMGIDPGALHRVSVMASDGLASLPHNGYIVTTIRNICGETFKRAYLPVAMVAVVLTTVAMLLAVVLFSIFG
ncbi:GntP family permease [Brevibacillus marinus]|uniref:GntP family permease n=1 Tax=Brevibacillus marinus TaxID=2496837 RepID=UPI000F834BCB|nr:GntP family permease [Brevibacillus marinus]